MLTDPFHKTPTEQIERAKRPLFYLLGIERAFVCGQDNEAIQQHLVTALTTDATGIYHDAPVTTKDMLHRYWLTIASLTPQVRDIVNAVETANGITFWSGSDIQRQRYDILRKLETLLSTVDLIHTLACDAYDEAVDDNLQDWNYDSDLAGVAD